jgi:hypothetical protein
MLTEKEKNELAIDCGYSEERYTDKVKEVIGVSEYDKDKENAIVRKMLKAFVDKELYGTPIPSEILSEFLKYYDDIEGIKAEAKKVIQSD